MAQTAARTTWIGQPVARLEDEALLRGQGRYMDDIDPVPHAGHAAILRSPLAHARINALDPARALELPGVIGVLTGADVARLSRPFPVGVPDAPPYYAAAHEVARYAGEPLAVVVARDRYVAEDALELIELDLEPLDAVADPDAGEVVSDRSFSYGDVDGAFARAELVVSERFRTPRWSCNPVETCGVVADWNRADGTLTAWSNFQGPFTLHSVAAGASACKGSALRLITPPDSGGSFGVKAAVYTYIVLLGLASRHLGVPVRWTEDRLEHLAAGSQATERRTGLEAAFARDGELLGAALRRARGRRRLPPRARAGDAVPDARLAVRGLPGAAVAARNRVVLTNRCPTGLNRGFGGPQLYFALERTMTIAARRLELDPAELRAAQLRPRRRVPLPHAVRRPVRLGRLRGLPRRRARARRLRRAPPRAGGGTSQGRRIGIGVACVVEPSISNMGYITLAQTAEERTQALPKSGNAEGATVSVSPLGGVTVRVGTTPQGQGHRTVCAQVTADALGLRPEDVDVITELDTSTSAWTVASGNYSSRFSGVGAGAVHLASLKVAAKLRTIAAAELGCDASAVELREGKAWHGDESVGSAGSPGSRTGTRRRCRRGSSRACTRRRSSAPPTSLRRTRTTASPRLRRTASSSTSPSSRSTRDGRGRGARLHDGQRRRTAAEPAARRGPDPGRVRARRRRGALRAGRLRRGRQPAHRHVHGLRLPDRARPAAAPDRPSRDAVAVHAARREGARRGNTMSAPVAIANAVADALGRDDVEVPLTPGRVWELLP